MNDSFETTWMEYLELPVRHSSRPTKLDAILAARLKAFLKAKSAIRSSR